jgi:PEP-CTERM motif
MRKYVALAATSIFFGSPALATDVLTFEGIPNQTPVGTFYAPNYVFSPATLALVDSDAGGTGSFANEPSPNTIMFFLNANNAVLNATNGFTTGFSFFYSSSTAATINVYDAPNATGNILASLNLAAQGFNNCVGDPTGRFCNWTPIGVNFAGTAFSIGFGGTANQTGFDNITFGSATPGTGDLPEPATWAMMIVGFGAVGSALRRRARKPATLKLA